MRPNQHGSIPAKLKEGTSKKLNLSPSPPSLKLQFAPLRDTKSLKGTYAVAHSPNRHIITSTSDAKRLRDQTTYFQLQIIARKKARKY